MIRFSASRVAVESFRASRDSLTEFLGVRVASETLRTHVESAATGMLDWQMAESVGDTFAKAPGHIEFQTDAGKVNTQEGWRDFKICTFAKRPEAAPATPDEWDTRVLPNVTARTTVVALESIEVFEKRLRPLAAHLGIENTCTIHTLGDGAEWIWNTATRQFPNGPQTLDVYHACEWISDASKLLYPQTCVCASQPAQDKQAIAPQAEGTMKSPGTGAATASAGPIDAVVAMPAAVATAATPAAVATAVAESVAAVPTPVPTPAAIDAVVATPAPTPAAAIDAVVAMPAAPAPTPAAAAAPPTAAASSAGESPGTSATQEKTPAANKTAKGRSPKRSAADKAKAKQAKRSRRKQARSQKPKSEHEKSYERGREQLLNKGWQGVCDYVAEELAIGDTAERRSALEGLLGYFSKHLGRLNYSEMLLGGLVIGSGMVEGNVKTIGLRLKARGARWKVENVTRMAELIGLRHSSYWNDYWSSMGSSCPLPRSRADASFSFTVA